MCSLSYRVDNLKEKAMRRKYRPGYGDLIFLLDIRLLGRAHNRGIGN